MMLSRRAFLISSGAAAIVLVGAGTSAAVALMAPGRAEWERAFRAKKLGSVSIATPQPPNIGDDADSNYQVTVRGQPLRRVYLRTPLEGEFSANHGVLTFGMLNVEQADIQISYSHPIRPLPASAHTESRRNFRHY